jgi:N-acetylated-alpha-linked acidic dipeptidase
VTTPSIPSLPISYRDALPLLLALNGHGLNASDLGGDWGAGGLYHKGVNYNIGPAPKVTVNLVNEVEYVITPQWDVIATIEGHIKDETVLMGNHRDAWIAGGAVDPNSGSAALIELARSFGTMLKSGWKPLRTIVLASWDGEEYGVCALSFKPRQDPMLTPFSSWVLPNGLKNFIVHFIPAR